MQRETEIAIFTHKHKKSQMQPLRKFTLTVKQAKARFFRYGLSHLYAGF